MGRSKGGKKGKKTNEMIVGSDIDDSDVEEEQVVAPAVEEPEPEPEEKKEKKKKPLPKNAQQGKGKGKGKKGAAQADEEEETKNDDAQGSDAEGDDAATSHNKKLAGQFLDGTFTNKILYCPNCTFPAEYCEYSGMYAGCKQWLREVMGEDSDLDDAEDKGMKKKLKNPNENPHKKARVGAVEGVKLTVKNIRGKKKVTTIEGLDQFGFVAKSLKDMASDFKKRFSCGCAMEEAANGKGPSLELQGDFTEELQELLSSDKYKVPAKEITVSIELKKKKPAQ